MYRVIIFFSVLILFPTFLLAQITPPGLGEANTALWTAFGVRQSLDSNSTKQSMSYIGIGRVSTPSSYNLLQQQAILVLNEEFYFRLHKRWQYTLALSYRRQNQYDDFAPYEPDTPSIKQEFRMYARGIYALQLSKVKLAFTLRQEFRKFFAPDFENLEENYQFRTRIRTQLSFSLDKHKKHRIILSSEQLFSISRTTLPQQGWTNFGYRESRFTIFYTYKPPKSSLLYSIGYMNNLLGNAIDVDYLSFDIIWENPFGVPRREKIKPVKFLE